MSKKRTGFRSHMFSMGESELDLHKNVVATVIFSLGQPSKVSNDSMEVEGSIISIKPDIHHKVVIGSEGAEILHLDGIRCKSATQDFECLDDQWAHIPKSMRDMDELALKEFRDSIGQDNYCNSFEMVEVIEKLYESPYPWMTQRELSMTLGLERTQALRFFKSVTGQTFRKFKKWAALIAAAHRAMNGEPIGLAAIETGFSDAAHATRSVAEAFGLTPTSALSSLASVITLKESKVLHS